MFDTAPNATNNRDRITDFNVADDTIELENSIFTALGLTTGTLTAAAFRNGTAAGDPDDRIIYNPTTGALFYDSNGNASGSSVQIAVVWVVWADKSEPDGVAWPLSRGCSS